MLYKILRGGGCSVSPMYTFYPHMQHQNIASQHWKSILSNNFVINTDFGQMKQIRYISASALRNFRSNLMALIACWACRQFHHFRWFSNFEKTPGDELNRICNLFCSLQFSIDFHLFTNGNLPYEVCGVWTNKKKTVWNELRITFLK